MTKPQKIQILTFLATLLVIGLVLAFLDGMSDRRAKIFMASQKVGFDLAATGNSSLLDSIGPDLRRRLGDFMVSTGRVATVRVGDAPVPIGDGKASACLYLINANKERIDIRLRVAADNQKLHVLGFWKPDALPD